MERSASPSSLQHLHRPVALCDALDRVLETGAVIVGEVMLTVADVDLIYLGFQLVLTSVNDGEVPHLTNMLKDVRVTISEPEARRELS